MNPESRQPPDPVPDPPAVCTRGLGNREVAAISRRIRPASPGTRHLLRLTESCRLNAKPAAAGSYSPAISADTTLTRLPDPQPDRGLFPAPLSPHAKIFNPFISPPKPAVFHVLSPQPSGEAAPRDGHGPERGGHGDGGTPMRAPGRPDARPRYLRGPPRRGLRGWRLRGWRLKVAGLQGCGAGGCGSAMSPQCAGGGEVRSLPSTPIAQGSPPLGVAASPHLPPAPA